VEIELTLVWAIIVTITLGIIITFLYKLKKTHDQDISHKEDEIQELSTKLDTRQKKSFQMGVNTTSGDYIEILGDFALLSKYDQIITLSTTSKAPSLDLIGINDESLDFIEIKKKGGTITKSENHVRRLVEEKKVSYKVFDIELPKSFEIKERELNKLKKKNIPKEKSEKINIQKIEAQKNNPNAYESWSESNDEFLKNYWNDQSNTQSRVERIQELCDKLGRNKGSINSRLNKLGLD
jgi:hypothetical protein